MNRIDPTRQMPDGAGERRLVLVDLDLTLFDYTQARANAAQHALAELASSDELGSATAAYDMLLERWESLKRLGLPNVRREWNAAEFYTIVIAAARLSGECSLEEVAGAFDRLDAADSAPAPDSFRSDRAGEKLWAAYERLSADSQHRRRIERAQDAFERNVRELTPFPDARPFLLGLRELPGVEGYITSEGDSSFQRMKIERLGLGDIVPRDDVFVTDEVASPADILDALAAPAIEESANRIRAGVGEPSARSGISPEDIARAVVSYHRSLFEGFEHKSRGRFFGRVVHLILARTAGLASEAKVANVSPRAWSTLPPIKLAVVGDRYTTDMRPAIEAFGVENCLTVRMSYGKYSDEAPGTGDAEPDADVRTLTEAGRILARSDSWASKKRLSRPANFGERLNAQNVSWILAGLRDAFPPTVRALAEAVLQDNQVEPETVAPTLRVPLTELVEWNANPEVRAKVQAVLASGT